MRRFLIIASFFFFIFIFILKIVDGENKILRPFGLIEVCERDTIFTVYDHVSKGIHSAGDNFVLSPNLRDTPIITHISNTIDGTLQTVPHYSKLKDVIEFGKYLTIKL
jgi:hypothetical protein